jgi:hypothetical protein
VTDAPEDHLVHEAVGPPISGLAAAGALGVGVNSLLVLGVTAVLLGALAAEHRLDNAGIGIVAAIEVLTMGIGTGLVGILLKPRRLRLIGTAGSVGLAAVDFATAGAHGLSIFVLRGLAGLIEGVLLWITVAMIARTTTPERWAGVFFTVQTLTQLLLAIALAVWILPRYGSAGGFASLTVCALIGIIPALFAPDRLADLNPGEDISGPPPLRGWVALIGTVVFVSGGGAVGVYLQPLAQEVGLDAGVARTANWVSLAAQVLGGASATAMAGRIRWFHVFVVTSAITLLIWRLFAMHIAGWLFVFGNATWGFLSIFLAPFLVPMTIEADPSRRAAVQSGAAQLLGGALGPFLAARMVSDADVHGSLWLGSALTVAGLGVVGWLHLTHRATEGS